jgi:hypothetical protein
MKIDLRNFAQVGIDIHENAKEVADKFMGENPKISFYRILKRRDGTQRLDFFASKEDFSRESLRELLYGRN